MWQRKNTFFLFFVVIICYYLYRALKASEYLEMDEKIPTLDLLNYNESFLETCNPIFQTSFQYSALIDGVEYPKGSVPLYLNKSINFECLNRNKHLFKILFWTKPNWLNDEFFGKFKSEQNCPVLNCEVVEDKKMVYESELVITHMRDKIQKLPKRRLPNQRYVFMLYESPVHSDFYGEYNDFYNLTSTYKIDSDFPGFYEATSSFEWKLNENFDERYNFSKNKNEFAVAVISNCHDNSQRLELISELQKYVSVKVFGNCGTNSCPTHFKNGTLGQCKEIIGAEYKFYFAFENSICTDYITEKFFEILRYDIIPVVLGKIKINKVIYPKASFLVDKEPLLKESETIVY